MSVRMTASNLTGSTALCTDRHGACRAHPAEARSRRLLKRRFGLLVRRFGRGSAQFNERQAQFDAQSRIVVLQCEMAAVRFGDGANERQSQTAAFRGGGAVKAAKFPQRL